MQSGEWDRTDGSPRPIRPSQADTPRAGVDVSLTKARRQALHLLSYRARSRIEIRRMLEKTHSPAVVEQVLEQLTAQGYLDDAVFAREWRRRREERRPLGRHVLERELRRRGVEREIIQEALAGYDEAGNAYRVALKMAQRLSDSGYPLFQAKVWRYLLSRGFEASAIYDTVNRLWRELADPHHCAVDPYPQEQERKET